jgi:hypothetical protein
MKKVRSYGCINDTHYILTDEEELAFKILEKRHVVTLEILEKNESIWFEADGMHTSNVDPKKFGHHKYADHDGTSDCGYGCGCWMGPTRSGGEVDPFGACPNNPKKNKT